MCFLRSGRIEGDCSGGSQNRFGVAAQRASFTKILSSFPFRRKGDFTTRSFLAEGTKVTKKIERQNFVSLVASCLNFLVSGGGRVLAAYRRIGDLTTRSFLAEGTKITKKIERQNFVLLVPSCLKPGGSDNDFLYKKRGRLNVCPS